MENTSNDLFKIQLNQEATISIQKTYIIARGLIAVGIIVVAINLGFFVLDYFITDHYFKDDGWTTRIRKFIVPVLNVVGLVMFFLQIFLYFNFFRKARRAILLNDSDLFNKSFHLFYKNSLYALAQFLINLLVSIYYFYSYYQILISIPA